MLSLACELGSIVVKGGGGSQGWFGCGVFRESYLPLMLLVGVGVIALVASNTVAVGNRFVANLSELYHTAKAPKITRRITVTTIELLVP